MRSLYTTIVSCNERKIQPISKDWSFIYIPMTEEEKEKYLVEKIEDPCWRIGVQPKDFVHI